MKNKSKKGTSIIGGADGPVSIFIEGESEKNSLIMRIQNYKYRCRSRKAKKNSCGHAYTGRISNLCDEYL